MEQAEDKNMHEKSLFSKRMTALMRQHHQEFMKSQEDDAAPAILSQTLNEVKIKEVKPSKLAFNPKLKATFKIKSALEIHQHKGFCKNSCGCYRKQRFRLKNSGYRSSFINLYTLLFLGLIINGDDIQLGDLLRWCREGYISFGKYTHFFPEDMTLKSSDRFILSKAFSHKSVLANTHQLARTFFFDGIKGPRIDLLIKRYVQELELPQQFYDYILRIFSTVDKLPVYYPKLDKEFPNYEAIALCYIIVGLKMLLGLDGVTENVNSNAAQIINYVLKLQKDTKDSKSYIQNDNETTHLFVWNDWVKYIEYRKICLSQYHYPTKMRLDPDDMDDPALFLHHQEVTKKTQNDGNIKNKFQAIIKNLLQRVEDNCYENKKMYPKFSPSLTPMASNIEDLLSWQYLNSVYSGIDVNVDILNENFSQYNMSFLLKPRQLIEELKKHGCHLHIFNHRANLNVNIDENLTDSTQNIDERISKYVRHRPVNVFDCKQPEWDNILMRDKIDNCYKPVVDKKVTLNVSAKQCAEINETNYFKRPKYNKLPVDLYLCHEHYWTRHYKRFKTIFKIESFEHELDTNFPPIFSWLLRECALIGEMSTLDLYSVLCDLEIKLINYRPRK